MDHGGHHREREVERDVELGVRGVHQRVRAGLDLVRGSVEVVRTSSASGDDLATDGFVGAREQCHRRVGELAAFRTVLDEYRVTFVAHGAAHRETVIARVVGDRARAVGGNATARDADIDVDEYLADSVARGASTVASESTATVTRAPHSANARSRASSTDSLARRRSSPRPTFASPSSSRGVAPVKPRWPRFACSRASDVHLCAFTCGRRRSPGSAAVIVSRLRVIAAVSTTSAGVGRSATRIRFPIVRRAAGRSRRRRWARHRRDAWRSLADPSPCAATIHAVVVGLEEPGVDAVAEPVARLVVDAHGHVESPILRLARVREGAGEEVDELLAEEDRAGARRRGACRPRPGRAGSNFRRARPTYRVGGAQGEPGIDVGGREPEIGHRGIDCLRTADFPQDHLGGEIVGDDDHEPGEVVERRLEAGREVAQHAAPVGRVVGGQRDSARRVERARGNKSGVVHEDERLGGALGRHHSVGTDADGLVGRQVARVDTEGTRPFADDRSHICFERHRARMARAADPCRGAPPDRPRLDDGGAAADTPQRDFLIPAERWTEAPDAAHVGSRPRYRSRRLQAPYQSLSALARRPRGQGQRVIWRSQATTSTSSGRSNSVPTAPVRA